MKKQKVVFHQYFLRFNSCSRAADCARRVWVPVGGLGYHHMGVKVTIAVIKIKNSRFSRTPMWWYPRPPTGTQSHVLSTALEQLLNVTKNIDEKTPSKKKVGAVFVFSFRFFPDLMWLVFGSCSSYLIRNAELCAKNCEVTQQNHLLFSKFFRGESTGLLREEEVISMWYRGTSQKKVWTVFSFSMGAIARPTSSVL